MTTIYLHNIASASVTTRDKQGTGGEKYCVTKLHLVDKDGCKYEIAMFSDEPMGLSVPPAVEPYATLDEDVEARR